MEQVQKERGVSAPEDTLKATPFPPRPPGSQPEIPLQDDHSLDLNVNGPQCFLPKYQYPWEK